MTNKDIMRIAMEQSAVDANCSLTDFLCFDPVIVDSQHNVGARAYYKWPIECNLISYGTNIVASVMPEYRDLVSEYIRRYPATNLMETPHMHILQQGFAPLGLSICFMAEYWLPDIERLRPLSCPYELRTLYPENFAELYKPEWSNALCEKRKHLDTLGIGAYDGDKLIGLAACSADCESMWQIGIDVLPDYRGRGIASALTSHLALAILGRGKVPFYCCAWCNVPSARNAIKSGFKPAWVEMTIRPQSMVDEFNNT